MSNAKPSNAKSGAQLHPLRSELDQLVQGTWKTEIATQLEKPSTGSPGAKSPPIGTLWSPRISPPLPAQWPQFTGEVIYLVSAYGLNFETLRDGEYEGGLWAKVRAQLKSPHALQLELITRQIQSKGARGVRPLNATESQALKVSFEQLLEARIHESAGKTPAPQLREAYCTAKKLGHFPILELEAHAAFFKWLNCVE